MKLSEQIDALCKAPVRELAEAVVYTMERSAEATFMRAGCGAGFNREEWNSCKKEHEHRWRLVLSLIESHKGD